MILNREEIKGLISKGLISGFIDLETQMTPNGFDLTVEKIFSFSASGSLDFSNKERKLPKAKEISSRKIKKGDRFGWWHLKQGSYKIATNETVNLALDLVAIAFSRTSLLRMGGFTQHGVWDAGFKGKGEFILVVDNPKGIRIKQNARIAQLVFIKMDKTIQGYNGIYHADNLEKLKK
jgi:dUTP pyrophosphatase